MYILDTVEAETTQVIDILCNKCGQSLKTDFEFPDGVHGSPFSGLLNAWTIGHTWSKLISNGRVIKFSLCEQCLLELIAGFKHPA